MKLNERKLFYRYIYGGRLPLEEYNTSDIIKFLEAAKELGLQESISHLQSSLIENKANWLEKNFSLVYQTWFFLGTSKILYGLNYWWTRKDFKSIDFISISEKALITLIQNDNLQLSKVQVWENVIK